MNKTIKNILSDIRFWIILFFVIRLIGITNPPLESAHNWRQTTVNMVARNFLEIDNNILYPRLDIAGDKTGITGMEFPLLNYLIYLLSEIFGYQHWYGRLINLFFSSFGLWYFFKLARNYFSYNVAFNSALILLFSIWFSYSRKIMPDTFSMSLILMSIYYGSNYLNPKSNSSSLKNISLYFLLGTLGILSKLPSAYLLSIFILPYFSKNILLNRKVYFLILSALSLFTVLLWYFYWVPHLVETYNFSYFFMGNTLSEGAQEIVKNFSSSLDNFYNSALKYIGFLLFITGIIYAFIKKEKRLLNILIISFLSFMLIILKMGFTFPHHAYYIIPFTPIMALVSGYGLSQIKYKQLSLILLISICAEGLLNRHHDFLIPPKNLILLNLEHDLNKVSQKDDLIVINGGSSSTPMYFAHRKGWSSLNQEIVQKEYIEKLRKNGLKLIVILKDDATLDLPVVLENKDYCIYKLD